MLKLLIASVLVTAVCASDVLEFTESDFDARISQYPFVLVEFYAPWCGHCKRLAPEYETAATILKRDDPPVPLAKVDCVAQKGLCDRFNVGGFPTLKIFKNGQNAMEYGGPREADGIVKYLRSKAGPSSREITSAEGLTALLARDDFVACGFFESESSPAYQSFKKVADQLSEDHRFCHSFAAELRTGDKASYANQLVAFQARHLHSKFEPTESTFEKLSDVEAAKSFVRDAARGLCGHRAQSNAATFGTPLVVVYYDVDYVKNEKGTNYWRNRVLKAASKLIRDEHKNVQFAISNANEFQQELGEYGIKADGKFEKPRVAARDAAQKKYVMTEEFSPEALEAFVNALLKGELESYMKSEAVPEPHKVGDVQVVVARQFDEIVNDPTKDVLIEFYAPWCGHCKSLAPKYDELAQKLKDESDIVIAKMDATANDVPPQFDVRGFPTLYFVPKGAKNAPKQYQGEREVKDFIKYIAREATDPLQGWDRDGKKLKTGKEEL